MTSALCCKTGNAEQILLHYTKIHGALGFIQLYVIYLATFMLH